jgi:hypothetical protein
MSLPEGALLAEAPTLVPQLLDRATLPSAAGALVALDRREGVRRRRQNPVFESLLDGRHENDFTTALAPFAPFAWANDGFARESPSREGLGTIDFPVSLEQ